MSGGKAWAIYILLRLGFFLVPFALLVWLGTAMWFPIWLAAMLSWHHPEHFKSIVSQFLWEAEHFKRSDEQ
jgi:hypothetical protein